MADKRSNIRILVFFHNFSCFSSPRWYFFISNTLQITRGTLFLAPNVFLWIFLPKLVFLRFFRIFDRWLENDQLAGFWCFFTIFCVFGHITAIFLIQILQKSQEAHFPRRALDFYGFSCLKSFFLRFFRISDLWLKNGQKSGFWCFFTIFRVFRLLDGIFSFQILCKSQEAHFPMRTIHFYDFSNLKPFFLLFSAKKAKNPDKNGDIL